MNHSEIIKQQTLIYQYLYEKKLKNALDLINNAVIDSHKGELIDMLYNVEMTYKSLLHYTVEGFTDPERQRIYNQLILDILTLADNVYWELLVRFGEGYYFETYRKIHHYKFIFEDVANNFIKHANNLFLLKESRTESTEPYPEINNSSILMFDFLLTQQSIWKTGLDTLIEIFEMEESPWYHLCTYTTAITLQLLYRFDIKGINFLLNLIDNNPDIRIKQRALTGILLLFYKYDNRLIYYPDIVKRIEAIQEDENFLEIVKTMIIQLLRTFETEELGRKLTDELLPEMTKINPNLRNRLDLDNILGDKFQEGKNPDWEELFPDSPELLDKLEEFSKLQIEGADMFMATFQMLKQFPFFYDVPNWFLPFFYPNSIIEEILKNEDESFKNKNIFDGFINSSVMCNSDKYSFVLSIPQMQEDQKQMMAKVFLKDIESMHEVEESDNLIDANKQALSISNQYIQDLYRFFKINPYRNSFINPFSWSFDFYNKWFINKIFTDDDLLNKLGEYFFEKDRYKEASEVFNILATRSKEPSMQLMQKQAYCQQQLHNYEEALKLYLKADIFKHGQIWNLKKIALCYRYLKNPENAVKYYEEAEKLQPDNLHTQVSIGHCFLEMKDYEEALKYYFKVTYLDPKNKKVWRPIAWCSLALGKFEQAEKYAMKSINKTPAQSDYLNMGHIKWCQNSRIEALQWYQKCVKFKGNNINDFLDSFENDKQILLSHNVDSSDIPIMLDQLRYYLDM
jgi:tetratricopeptide (TPR) repeat protein